MTALAGSIPGALASPQRKATHHGADGWAHAVLGRIRRRVGAGALMREAGAVLERCGSLASAADNDLELRAEALRGAARCRREDAATARESFALVTECIRRETGLTLHTAQIAAGLAMMGGAVAELATGEGKTFAAILPAVLAGWRGRGCHIVTANDYLAMRDARANAPIFARLGLTVGCVTEAMSARERAAAYRADVTYATARELAGDFLRDRLDASRGVMRPLAEAIVDEADFVLIDEAATPLILAAPSVSRDEAAWIRVADDVARSLVVGEHFRVDRPRREVRLTDASEGVIGSRLDGSRLPMRRARELVAAALRAHHLHHRDADYAVVDGRVLIVDERTGRISPDRRWRDGLHEAIEAKEGVEVRPSDDTLASISFQRFFCLYPRLSGMTGTARQCAGELWNVYWLRTAVIPTHRPVIRRELRAHTCGSREEAMEAAAREAVAMGRIGRPVLIATTTVDASEALAGRLSALGVGAPVLNAVRHAEEASIIARAGRSGAITIATNMAGRGTDIVLDEAAREAGGLHVIALGHQVSRRIDRQLFGRAGRQGDPGSARVIRSPGDDLLARNGAPWLRCVPTAWRFAMVQRFTERRGRRDRRSVMRRDHTLDDLLAFASA